MRNRITRVGKLRSLAALVGRPVLYGVTRGGTDHRIDVCCADGSAWSVFRDGTVEPSTPYYEQTMGKGGAVPVPDYSR